MASRTVRTLLGAALVVGSATAGAAGFEIPDNGTQALGRGGAFTAIADDGTAIQYNPAGLAQSEGLNLTIDTNLVNHAVTFARRNPDGETDKVDVATVSNSAGTFVAPMAAVSYGRKILANDTLSVAAGVYGPSSYGHYVFPRGGTTTADDLDNGKDVAGQRYQLIENDLFIVYPTVSVAYRLPLPTFVSVGISGQAVYSHFQFDQNIYAQPSQQTAFGTTGANGSKGVPNKLGDHKFSERPPTSIGDEDQGWDANVKVDMKGQWRLAGIFSALAKFGPAKVGVSFRPGYKLHLDGTMNVTLPPVLSSPDAAVKANAKVSGNEASLDLNWPSILRIGVGSDIPMVPGKLDVAGEFTYETWSVVDKFVLTPKNIEVTSDALPPQKLAAVNIAKNMRDTWTARLGAQYELPIPMVIVQTRLGGYYERSALPEEYTTVDLAHFDRIAFTGGASVGLKVGDVVGPLMLDLGALYSPTSTREVRNGAVTLTTSDEHLAKGAVNNGDYTSSVFILSAGIRGHFAL